MVGVSRGSVILKNWRNLPAPSMLAASYRDGGICLSEDRKISIEEPNCQTASKIKVQIAVFLSPSQDTGSFMPKTANTLLMTPPMMEGR